MRLYVETSVWNFLLVNDDLNKREITRYFFEQALDRDWSLFVSPLVFDEIRATLNVNHREALLETIESYNPRTLPALKEAFPLADRYISEGAMTQKHFSDALHLAHATIAEMELIVSWNMRQIARRKTRNVVRDVNILLGYKILEIATPEEVIDYEEA